MDTDFIYKKAMDQLKLSLMDAKSFKDSQANNCYLATSGVDGQPSVRIITIHEVEDKGLFFLANKNSGKIIQVNHNPQVGLCFYWQTLGLQATIEGVVEIIDNEVGEGLWAKRDHHAKITAWAFDLAEDEMGKDKLDYYKKKTRDNFQESLPPLAKSWSGFLIRPTRIEFWKNDWRKNKCRDCYQKKGSVWQEFHHHY
jgi:pyridoxamine 5'-phosphate oxidase